MYVRKRSQGYTLTNTWRQFLSHLTYHVPHHRETVVESKRLNVKIYFKRSDSCHTMTYVTAAKNENFHVLNQDWYACPGCVGIGTVLCLSLHPQPVQTARHTCGDSLLCLPCLGYFLLHFTLYCLYLSHPLIFLLQSVKFLSIVTIINNFMKINFNINFPLSIEVLQDKNTLDM